MLLSEIKSLHQAGKIEEAKQGYTALIAADPENVEAWHFLGILYAEQADYLRAEECLNKALGLAPNDASLYLHLANILKAQEKYAEAMDIIKEGIARSPAFPGLYHNLGTLYFVQHQWRNAADAYQTAIELQANYIDAYYHLGLAFIKLNELNNAKNTFQALISLAPAHAGGLFQIACCYMKTNNFQEAVSYFLKMIKNYPFHFETQSNLAACYLKLGRLNHAKSHYLQALAIEPDDTQILFNLGVIDSQLGMIDQAITYYQQALAVNPSQFEVHNNLAVIYLARRAYQDALIHFREALRLQPENAAIRYFVQVLNRDAKPVLPPVEYIQSLFDAYADHYDAHLTDILHYQLPAKFLQLVQNQSIDKMPLDILDLGCGTGLCGEAFKSLAKSLVGVDLSANMLAYAQQKHCYDQLVQADIMAFLRTHIPATFDFVIAADTLVYFAELEILFGLIAAILRTGGLFIFNCEISKTETFELLLSGRFAHQKTYLDRVIAQTGFHILQYKKEVIRYAEDKEVLGHLYLIEKLNH